MSLRLTPSQRRVVEHDEGPLLVVAGPGAGKTRVLVERLRRLLKQEGFFRVLALTFTNKAANEVKERLQDIQDLADRAFIGTVHSFCVEVLESRGKAIGFSGPVNILESYADRLELFTSAVRQDPSLLRLLSQVGDSRKQTQTLGKWLGMISEHKASLRTPDLVEDDTERALYAAYDSGLSASAAVDFDDILLLAYRILEESPKIAGFYRRQYRYVFVDEAQDLNEAQYRILCALCGADHKNVMLVGDPKQAIFVWNGADPKYLDLFVRDFGAETLSLNENFRSSRAVVRAAQALNRSYAVEGQVPIEGQLTVSALDDEHSEAEAVTGSIAELLASGHPSLEGSMALEQCAILGRNRYVFADIEKAVKSRGWQYHSRLSTGAFHSESELIQSFELALRLLANPHDRLHLNRLSKLWDLNEGADDLRSLVQDDPNSGPRMIKVLCQLADTETSQIIKQSVDALDAGGDTIRIGDALAALESASVGLSDASRALALADIAEWKRHWTSFLRSHVGGNPGLRVFLSSVALGVTEQAKGQGIALLTVHASKGMEFDVVFLVGMCEGVFPDYRAVGPALTEEERNAFVAVTRARRLLYLSYPKSRVMPWGDAKAQKPSRYWRVLSPLADRA